MCVRALTVMFACMGIALAALLGTDIWADAVTLREATRLPVPGMQVLSEDRREHTSRYPY
jgi:hypothetical protein